MRYSVIKSHGKFWRVVDNRNLTTVFAGTYDACQDWIEQELTK